MKSSEIKGFIRKGDIIIISSVILLSALWFLFPLIYGVEEKQVNIYLDGETVHSFALSSLEEEQTVKAGLCTVRVTKEGACFISSECPDGLCVKRGMMSRAGDVMACVPQGVTVEIRADRNNIDGITY